MKYTYSLILEYFKTRKINTLLSVLLYIAASVLAMLPAKIIQLVIDEGFLKRSKKSLLIFTGLLLFVYVCKSVFSYISNKKLIELGNGLLVKFKSKIYDRLMSMDLSFYSNYDIGYINSRVEEIGTIDTLFSSQTLTLFSSILEFVFAVIILFSINPSMLFILSIPIPFLIIASVIVSKGIRKQIYATMDSSAEYSGKIQDTLHGMETVKTQGFEELESEKLDRYNKQAMDNQKEQSISINKFSIGMGSMGSIITVIVYLIGGWFFIDGDLTMGSFVAISTYAGKLYSPILGYASMSILIQPALLALKRVSEFFFKNNSEKNATMHINSIDSIQYNNVTFMYEENAKLINNLNINIKKGEKIQITGKNGSGKSTCIRMIFKLIQPQNGSILINGIDINEINTNSIIQQISYVSQKNYVFNESIHNNILYGIYNPDMEKYNQIVEKIGLLPVIKRLEEEQDGKIGENGARLSGGEIQKICIARALLLDRSIFIFDEAMTNLDKETKDYVMECINKSKATWIVIDHEQKFVNYGFREIRICEIDK